MLRTLAISLMILISVLSPAHSARTYIVDDDSFAEFTNLSEATRAASDGDTIYIKPGEYSGEAVLNSTVTIKPLIGEQGAIVLEGNGGKIGIEINSDGCIVEGLTITGYSEAGIAINSNRNTITNNVLDQDRAGILIKGGAKNVIDKNAIFGCFGGIVLYSGAAENTVSNNAASACNFSLILNEASKNRIFDNNISTCSQGMNIINSTNSDIRNNLISDAFNGIVLDNSSLTTVSACTIDNAANGIALGSSTQCDIQDNTLRSLSDTAVNLIASTANNVKGNSIEKSENGLVLADSSLNNIESNTLTDVSLGLYVDGDTDQAFNNNVSVTNIIDGKPVLYIYDQKDLSVTNRELAHLTLAHSTNCTVSSNRITNDAIFLFSSRGNRIIDNKIEDCYGGIRLRNSDNNDLVKNEASGNQFVGIFLYNSTSNLIVENNLSENAKNGLALIYLSDRNNVTSNLIRSNGEYGVRSNYSNENKITANTVQSNPIAGIWMDNSNASEIRENNISDNGIGVLMTAAFSSLVYHNNFLDNTEQAVEHGNNTWDNGSIDGGNYWSDHQCRGRPCEDYSKLIEGAAIDRYPYGEVSGWTLPKPVKVGEEIADSSLNDSGNTSNATGALVEAGALSGRSLSLSLSPGHSGEQVAEVPGETEGAGEVEGRGEIKESGEDEVEMLDNSTESASTGQSENASTQHAPAVLSYHSLTESTVEVLQ